MAQAIRNEPRDGSGQELQRAEDIRSIRRAVVLGQEILYHSEVMKRISKVCIAHGGGSACLPSAAEDAMNFGRGLLRMPVK